MNILITSEAAGIAGSTYSVSYLAKGLAHRGHKVWVACPRGTLLWKLVENTQVEPVHFTFASKLHLPSIRQLASLVREYNIELINAQSSKDRYTTILAKWWYKLPVKLIHTRRQIAKSIGALGQNTFYTKGTNAIVAVSEGVKQSIQAIGIPEQHIQVIYNGTPKEKYTNIKPEIISSWRNHYQIQPNELVIGCVARYKEQKQLLTALKFVNQPTHVLFVGIEEAPELKAVREQLPTHHRVHYAGSINNNDVLHHYPLFTVNVLPSVIEGLSQSLLEAMALGVPVIATKIGGNPELIQHGVNGFLFENENEQQLAQYINQLLSNTTLQQSFSEAGRRTALDDFSIDRMLNQYEFFFQKLTQDK
ncbi:glycosyltransferase family 4 protein [Tunicatimonas pelagia]|uniref:glycosyltransferase family 4 protein n=1 Tax=Tunicatimonas pelagia TaxID=931531 RepID=UPI002666402C|nr:glycosyltransferase family 4 protein [Tunicatimonas pelagia]WKN41951.1 glycosyltransferase family 4 protein [Tunicatimonas pelagia]